MSSATSSGCSTMLVAWLITPGTSMRPAATDSWYATRQPCFAFTNRALLPSMRASLLQSEDLEKGLMGLRGPRRGRFLGECDPWRRGFLGGPQCVVLLGRNGVGILVLRHDLLLVRRPGLLLVRGD